MKHDSKAFCLLLEGWICYLLRWGRFKDGEIRGGGWSGYYELVLGVSGLRCLFTWGYMRLELMGKIPTSNRNLGIINK